MSAQFRVRFPDRYASESAKGWSIIAFPLQDQMVGPVRTALLVISGIGEQPAIIHLRDFELGGFTSGCVCINPRLSAESLFIH